MVITYDPAKREITLRERGLDFDDAATVFTGIHATLGADRKDFGEPRFITAGFLKGRMVVLVWTPRGKTRRVISMRFAHEKEEKRWHKVFDKALG